ncbi:hypothetical protein VTI74DRAFT_418 [Chaetomium olivicolor]
MQLPPQSLAVRFGDGDAMRSLKPVSCFTRVDHRYPEAAAQGHLLCNDCVFETDTVRVLISRHIPQNRFGRMDMWAPLFALAVRSARPGSAVSVTQASNMRSRMACRTLVAVHDATRDAECSPSRRSVAARWGNATRWGKRRRFTIATATGTRHPERHSGESGCNAGRDLMTGNDFSRGPIWTSRVTR